MNALLYPINSLIVFFVLLPGFAQAFCFEEAGSVFNLSPRLLESIASIESGMNPAATNRNRNGSIDLGLMQVNTYWIGAARLDQDRLINDPCYNTKAGARILRGCIDRLGYTWEAVGCYNATSSDKRKNYSWKVYRQLLAAGKKVNATLTSSSPVVEILPPESKNNASLIVRLEE